MIQSLIAQLLRQFPYPTISPSLDLSIHGVERASLEQLGILFLYLIRQLPFCKTVFCFIDGINEYEREEYLQTMDLVVVTLLDLFSDGSRAHFTLLLMSPRPTTIVRQEFDDEVGVLLHMQ